MQLSRPAVMVRGLMVLTAACLLYSGSVVADGNYNTCLYGYGVNSSYPPGSVNLNAVIATGNSLINDGMGEYDDGVNAVSVYAHGALMFHPRFSENCPPVPPYSRYVLHDLSHPIGRAQNYGTVHDYDSWVAVSSAGHKAEYVVDMPIGVSESSAITEVTIYITGTRYVLHFGPGTYPNNPNVNGNGTTRPTITRTSATTWSVDAPPGSIGRLFSNPSANKPKDLGLYYYQFHIDYTAHMD